MSALARAAILSLLCASPALASDFSGVWQNADTAEGGIARIQVSGTDAPTIHLFGRCAAGECDWGTARAHPYGDGPASHDLTRLTADFNAGFARKHLELRLAPGDALHFDIFTDFTDGSGRADFASSGRLVRAAETAPAATVPMISATAPAPAVTAAATPPAPQLAENCRKFDASNAFVTRVNSTWHFVGGITLVDFRTDHESAAKASIVIPHYGFDEQCTIPDIRHPVMMYWKSAGEIPHGILAGVDCTKVDPATVAVKNEGGAWQVRDGSALALDFGSDRPSAELAASVIHAYRLTRECKVGALQYWLAE